MGYSQLDLSLVRHQALHTKYTYMYVAMKFETNTPVKS